LKRGGSPSAVPIIVAKVYDLILWWFPKLERFPRTRRFTLGHRLEQELINLIVLLVRAAYTHEKRELLNEAARTIEVVRVLTRLCHEVRLLGHQQFEHASKLMFEIGSMVGGWRKSIDTGGS